MNRLVHRKASSKSVTAAASTLHPPETDVAPVPTKAVTRYMSDPDKQRQSAWRVGG